MTGLRWPRRAPRETGQAAEAQACGYLQSRGLQLLTRNYTVRGGELDLVMQDGDSLVFVEVRYRRQSDHGSPLESITATKQARLRKAAGHFLQQHPQLADRPCRFDVIGLTADRNGRATIEWVRDAFA